MLLGIGTRGGRGLALTQAGLVADLLRGHGDVEIAPSCDHDDRRPRTAASHSGQSASGASS